MVDRTGESKSAALRLNFDRRLLLQFRGFLITSDGGLLAYRELDDVLGLTTSGGKRLAEGRTGKNRRHLLVGLLRQSVFGRLAGYEDVNDAERLCHDPAMRWIIGGKAAHGRAASPSQMGRFETRWLTVEKNLSALADLSGLWIDLVHGRRPPKGIVLDMDSSVSPTHGEQENSTWNGHHGSTGYHPLFVFNQFGDKPRLRACGGEADRVGGSRCAGGRGRGAGPEQQIYEVVGRGRGRVRRFVARCHIDRGRSAGCRLRCRARGEIAHQANKHG